MNSPPRTTTLDRLDMDARLDRDDYESRLLQEQARLNRLYRRARDLSMSWVVVFEGWDAAGKGGAIRRITPALDARDYHVLSVAAPTVQELSQHYLWRFWRDLPRAGQIAIFDRSWYGRVLVERIEGFATEKEWRRAYDEINDFEAQLLEHGMFVAKYWIHITRDEQERRFERRRTTAHKRWKLTEEDWRNRARWDEYEHAVNDMVERTGTPLAPWTLVAGNDKRFARIQVLSTLADGLEQAVERYARTWRPSS